MAQEHQELMDALKAYEEAAGAIRRAQIAPNVLDTADWHLTEELAAAQQRLNAAQADFFAGIKKK